MGDRKTRSGAAPPRRGLQDLLNIETKPAGWISSPQALFRIVVGFLLLRAAALACVYFLREEGFYFWRPDDTFRHHIALMWAEEPATGLSRHWLPLQFWVLGSIYRYLPFSLRFSNHVPVLMNVLLTTGVLWFIFAASRAVFKRGSLAGLFAVLFIGAFPVFIQLGLSAEAIPLVQFLVAAGTYFWTRYREKNEYKYRAASVLLFTLATYGRHEAWIFVAVLTLVLLGQFLRPPAGYTAWEKPALPFELLLLWSYVLFFYTPVGLITYNTGFDLWKVLRYAGSGALVIPLLGLALAFSRDYDRTQLELLTLAAGFLAGMLLLCVGLKHTAPAVFDPQRFFFLWWLPLAPLLGHAAFRATSRLAPAAVKGLVILLGAYGLSLVALHDYHNHWVKYAAADAISATKFLRAVRGRLGGDFPNFLVESRGSEDSDIPDYIFKLGLAAECVRERDYFFNDPPRYPPSFFDMPADGFRAHLEAQGIGMAVVHSDRAALKLASIGSEEIGEVGKLRVFVWGPAAPLRPEMTGLFEKYAADYAAMRKKAPRPPWKTEADEVK